MECLNYHNIKLNFMENSLHDSLTHLIFPDTCRLGFYTTSCHEIVLTFLMNSQS
jgi:hypothetical protein